MADTYDLLTLTEGKRAVGQATNTDSGFVADLESAITSVSQRIVDICGPVVTRTFTSETYDGGSSDIVLRNAAWGPLATTTISAISEYDTTGTATALTLEDYDTKPTEGFLVIAPSATVLRRYSGGIARFTPGIDNVVVTYTSSRAANTAAVPAIFKEAARVMLAHVWRQRGPQAGAFRNDLDGQPVFGVAPFSLPRAVTDNLAHHIHPAKRYGIG